MRKYKRIVIIVMMMLLTGCAGNDKETKNPDSEVPAVTEGALQGTDDTQVADESRGSEAEKEILEQTGPVAGNTIGSYVDNSIIVFSSEGVSHNWEQAGEQTGIHGNLEANMKSDVNILICKDMVYDVLYYIGDDYKIYAVKDGVCEKVVDIPAGNLYCWNGDLYFRIRSYGQYKFEGMAEGNICRYSPISGETEFITQEIANTIYVDKEGVYYFVNGKGVFLYEFATGNTNKVEDVTTYPLKWKEYKVAYGYDATYISDRLLLLDETGEEVRMLTPEFVILYNIIGDSFFYRSGAGNKYQPGTLVKVDLLTGDELAYVESTGDGNTEKPYSISDYIVIGDVLYGTNWNELIALNVNTGELLGRYEFLHSETVAELFTDGTKLYGSCLTNVDGRSYAYVTREIEIAVTDQYEIDPLGIMVYKSDVNFKPVYGEDEKKGYVPDVCRMLIACQGDIDIVSADGRTAYYHMDDENADISASENMELRRTGEIGDLPRIYVSLEPDTYEIKITADKDQSIFVLAEYEKMVYGIENYEISKGDVITVSFSDKAEPVFRLNEEVIKHGHPAREQWNTGKFVYE